MSEFKVILRECIKEYLEMKRNLNVAAARVVNEKKYHIIDDIAKNYELPYIFLKQKVSILNLMYYYDEERNAYETAVGSVLNNIKTPETAAIAYKLDLKILREEIKGYILKVTKNTTEGPYIYDKCLAEGRVFFFREELSLMVELRQWKYRSLPPCTCLICAIELLPSLAYHFARKIHRSYPPSWNVNMRADIDWLLKFVMAHDCRLLKLYPNYDNNVQELFESCKKK